MKRVFFTLLLTGTIVFLGSCLKNQTPACTNNTVAIDKHVIDSFLNVSGTTANYTYDAQAGVYYSIVTPGTGSTPSADSLVAFEREVKLLNNTSVDKISRTPANYSLNSYQNALITYALTKVKEGGMINVIIPSSSGYAFGCAGAKNTSGQQVVPPNAQLLYIFNLTDVKAP